MKENNHNSNIRQTNLGVTKTLGKSHIHEALTFLMKESLPYPDIQAEARRCKETYEYMLKYFLTGAEDPGREEMLADLKAQLFELADMTDRRRLLPLSADTYFATRRILDYRHATMADLLIEYQKETETQKAWLTPKIEELLSTIFQNIWTLEIGRAEDLRLARDFALQMEQTDRMLPMMIVAALYMGLNAWYDHHKLLTLISIYESTLSEVVAARSLTAILLIVSQYRDRVEADRQVKIRLQGLSESLITYRRLREVVRLLLRARDSERISAKMQSELLPGMMNIDPQILRKLQEEADVNPEELLGQNPEWEEMLEKSGMTEKLREFMDLQMEGADVMLLPFSNLKSFPFFGNVANWFLPFNSRLSRFEKSDLKDLLQEDSPLAEVLHVDRMMCDSDKYSFVFGLESMPSEKRQAFANHIKASSQQLQEMRESLPKGSGTPEFDQEADKFVRNIYRFFKLNPKRGEYADPFESFPDFADLPVLGAIIQEEEIVELIATFYFKRGYYQNAVPMLRRLISKQGGDYHLWEKLGYSLERIGGHDKEVLECYAKAELFNPDSKWLNLRLGNVYSRLGNWKLAEEYLLKSLADTSDPAELRRMASVCTHQQKYDEALKYLYKSEYLVPGDISTLIEISRLEMLEGNFEKALKRVESLPEKDLPVEGILLKGHLEFLRGDYRRAADNYRKVGEILGIDKAEGEIREAMSGIVSIGASPQKLDLLIDSLRITPDI